MSSTSLKKNRNGISWEGLLGDNDFRYLGLKMGGGSNLIEPTKNNNNKSKKRRGREIPILKIDSECK